MPPIHNDGSLKRISWTLRILIPAVLLGWSGAVRADVRLPSVIGDHMVLQQGMPAPIWGKADPGEAVTVSFAGQTRQTVADADGRWMIRLAALNAAPEQTGQTLTVAGKNTLAVRDVLVGEVWICSGQSNMQFPVGRAAKAQDEIVAARFPMIRMFIVANRMAPTAQDDCEGQWTVCSPETVSGFSAVGYFFGRHLYQTLKAPVGLLNTSWGGTIAEAWVSAEALQKNLPEFIPALEQVLHPDGSNALLVAEYKARKAAWDADMESFYSAEENLADTARYAAPDVDDVPWKTMSLPGNWESRGEPNLDGLVWFRKTVDLPAAWAGKDIILNLGPIDEVDVTWFNGVQVGARGRSRTREVQFWNQPRHYRVPGRWVKAGPNVLAIRVSDSNGEGGLWGGSGENMTLELADAADAEPVSLAGEWRYFVELVLKTSVRPVDPESPNRPSVLFNAMIHPLIPFALRGAIWYQGESNAGRAMQYRTLLPTLISDWRARFPVGNFPFLIVQLANFRPRTVNPEESKWAELREAQTLTTTRLPNVGQALAIDIGDAQDIHPTNKQEVGRRLGLAAEAIAYHRPVVFTGPTFKSLRVLENQAELTFTGTDGGLRIKGDVLKGFAIRGEDGKWVWAQAEIRGDTVIVSAPDVPHPVAVRYAWSDNPECNLYNGADLPAVPFRSDCP